jgi:hypothetical protein
MSKLRVERSIGHGVAKRGKIVSTMAGPQKTQLNRARGWARFRSSRSFCDGSGGMHARRES